MELFSPEFFSALAAIIIIDLALAGDNAIVIALAARNLPPQLQRKAIFWGTAGAIGVRVVMTLAVVWLLGVPGLMAAGGAVLAWTAGKMIVSEPLFAEYFDDHDLARYGLYALVFAVVFGSGFLARRRRFVEAPQAA
jgi:predicted tellurium resistance membrane protein TerC